MDKQEKVMKGLECCTHGVNKCAICPYDPRYNKIDEINARSCMTQLAMDALELLKAQELEISRLKNHVDCEAAETTPAGCVGYGRDFNDDEPCEKCKQCQAYNGYGEE